MYSSSIDKTNRACIARLLALVLLLALALVLALALALALALLGWSLS